MAKKKTPRGLSAGRLAAVPDYYTLNAMLLGYGFTPRQLVANGQGNSWTRDGSFTRIYVRTVNPSTQSWATQGRDVPEASWSAYVTVLWNGTRTRIQRRADDEITVLSVPALRIAVERALGRADEVEGSDERGIDGLSGRGGGKKKTPRAKVVQLGPRILRAKVARKLEARAKVQDVFDSAFDIMSQDPGFEELRRERETQKKKDKLQAGPQRFKVGDKVWYGVDREARPWDGTIVSAQYREHDIDGPGHYYEVKWWDEQLKQNHEDYLHQDDLVPAAKKKPCLDGLNAGPEDDWSNWERLLFDNGFTRQAYERKDYGYYTFRRYVNGETPAKGFLEVRAQYKPESNDWAAIIEMQQGGNKNVPTNIVRDDGRVVYFREGFKVFKRELQEMLVEFDSFSERFGALGAGVSAWEIGWKNPNIGRPVSVSDWNPPFTGRVWAMAGEWVIVKRDSDGGHITVQVKDVTWTDKRGHEDEPAKTPRRESHERAAWPSKGGLLNPDDESVDGLGQLGAPEVATRRYHFAPWVEPRFKVTVENVARPEFRFEVDAEWHISTRIDRRRERAQLWLVSDLPNGGYVILETDDWKIQQGDRMLFLWNFRTGGELASFPTAGWRLAAESVGPVQVALDQFLEQHGLSGSSQLGVVGTSQWRAPWRTLLRENGFVVWGSMESWIRWGNDGSQSLTSIAFNFDSSGGTFFFLPLANSPWKLRVKRGGDFTAALQKALVKQDEVMTKGGLSKLGTLASTPDEHTKLARQDLEKTDAHLNEVQLSLSKGDCPGASIFLDAANKSYGSMAAHIQAGGRPATNDVQMVYIALTELIQKFHDQCLVATPPDDVDKWLTRTMRKTARKERGDEVAKPVVSLDRFKKLKKESGELDGLGVPTQDEWESDGRAWMARWLEQLGFAMPFSYTWAKAAGMGSSATIVVAFDWSSLGVARSRDHASRIRVWRIVVYEAGDAATDRDRKNRFIREVPVTDRAGVVKAVEDGLTALAILHDELEEKKPPFKPYTTTVVLPAFLASALINGDMTGLEDGEEQWVQAAVDYVAPGRFVDVGESYFAHYSDLPGYELAGDVAKYTVLFTEPRK